MYKFSLAGIIILSVFISACTSSKIDYGKVVSEKREVSYCSSIVTDGYGEVHVTQGDTTSVSVETYKDFQKYVDIDIYDKHLSISITKDLPDLNKELLPIKVNVTMKKLRIMDLKGNSSVFAEKIKQPEIFINTLDKSRAYLDNSEIENLNILNNSESDITCKNLKLKNLMVEIINSGNVRIDELATSFIRTEIIETGDIILSGKSDLINILIMNTGELYSQDLICKSVDAVIDGRGSAFVNAENGIAVKVFGSGNLFYKGTPKAIIYKGDPSQVVKLFGSIDKKPIVDKDGITVKKSSES